MREIKYLGKMPDPFKKEDGCRMTPSEWQENKKKILEKIVDTEYGGMPPRPEVVEFELLCEELREVDPVCYKVYAGTKEKQVSFMLELHVPYVEGYSPCKFGPFGKDEKYPVILTGDGCYDNMDAGVIKEANKRGFIAAKFNRLEFANDLKGSREGGLHRVYEGRYTDIAAWAWGYMVCMDVFEKLSIVDETEVGITGHSRGGKTVMLAAAVDERIKYVCPNNSGCHGAVSYRCQVTGQGDDNRVTESLETMLDMFPTWMGDKLTDYKGHVEDLPYDMHYFGAMIAPRYYLQCEGMQDYWINPIGAWQNYLAVKECYKYLGCESHAAGWFRPGQHRHRLPDYIEFMDFIQRSRAHLPLREHLEINPYPKIEKNFEW